MFNANGENLTFFQYLVVNNKPPDMHLFVRFVAKHNEYAAKTVNGSVCLKHGCTRKFGQQYVLI